MQDETPQLEDGYTRLANELFDAILAFPFSGRQLKVLMTIVRKTYGYNKKRDDMSASQIANVCGLPRPHVSEVLGQLAAMNVISKETGRFGSIIELNKNYREWHEIDEKRVPKEKVPRGESKHTSHYTYRITRLSTGEFYLGVRSCSCHPNQDRYMGSGNWIATMKAAELTKEVLATYESREAAEEAEKEIIRAAVGNPLLRNTTLYERTESVQRVQDLYRCTESVQGVQKTYSASTESVQVASTDSVHTKDNLPKDNQQKELSGVPDTASEIIGYLNRETGCNFQTVPANVKFVLARVKEGATLEQMKRVIDAKVREWLHDPKMKGFLRPATLFNATNYAQYAGALGAKGANGVELESLTARNARGEVIDNPFM